MKYDTGFSLIELLVTLSIITIGMMVAAPPMATMIKNNRLVTHANTFITAVNTARSEAINRQLNVILCPSTTGTGCTASSWESGWIIYVDGDSDGAYTGNPPDTILRVQPVLSGTTTIVARAGTGYENDIAYTPRGYAPSGELIVCDDRLDLAVSRAIAISGTGRPQTMANNNLTTPFLDCAGN